MAPEAPISTQDPIVYESLESLKAKYKARLDAILYKQITVENIDDFADEALEDTVSLMEELLNEYRNNPNFKSEPDAIPAERQEDKASEKTEPTDVQEDKVCEKLELPNVPEILGNIMAVQSKIDGIKIFLENGGKEHVNEVIMHPEKEERKSPERDGPVGEIQGTDDRKFEVVRELRPRLLTLLYIIETDFDIDRQNISITEGEVTSDMIRKTPYVRVIIPDLDRIVYICDEVGNASYVFDMNELRKHNVTIEELDNDGKHQEGYLIGKFPKIGIRVIQTSRWRDNMSRYLAEELPDQEHASSNGNGSHSRKRSEFSTREKTIPLYEDFENEVRAVYNTIPEDEKPEDIAEWYAEEYPKHKGWPSTPTRTYAKRGGWKGYPELVGLERFSKGSMSFDDFREVVLREWKDTPEYERIGKTTWYKKIRQQKPELHLPSNPNDSYKNTGWPGGWTEFFKQFGPKE